MTIEIRELVIEARVQGERDTARVAAPSGPIRGNEEARWVEQVARRVLELLSEQRERL